MKSTRHTTKKNHKSWKLLGIGWSCKVWPLYKKSEKCAIFYDIISMYSYPLKQPTIYYLAVPLCVYPSVHLHKWHRHRYYPSFFISVDTQRPRWFHFCELWVKLRLNQWTIGKINYHKAIAIWYLELFVVWKIQTIRTFITVTFMVIIEGFKIYWNGFIIFPVYSNRPSEPEG